MKNIWLLIVSMIPGFMVAEQSWAEWTFGATKACVGQGLSAMTYASSIGSSIGSKVISASKKADSADVTIGVLPLLYGRKLYKTCKNVNWGMSVPSLYNTYSTYTGMSTLKVLKLLKPVPAAVAVGFVHHILTSHTPMKWAEKQKKKS